MKMNARLLAYLRSLGLGADASDSDAWDFFRSLRGLQASVANALNYDEEDAAARTNCDLMIRALGYDPAQPQNLLSTSNDGAGQRVVAGTDGASLGGEIERARREGADQERRRVAEIRQAAAIAGTPEELIRSLVEDPQVTAEAARERIFQEHQARTRAQVAADRPTGLGAAHSRNSVTGITAEVLAAAMLHRHGINPVTHWVTNENDTPTPHRGPQQERERVAELAWQYRRMSLEDVIRAAARIDNVTLPPGRNGLLAHYLQSTERSASTSTLSVVFTTIFNSELLMAYETAPSSTRGGWVRENDVTDFKANERGRMVNGGTLKKLPRGSEAEHATFDDIVETFKIARYASQFVIDDQDIVDDTFGSVGKFVPADFGVSARHLEDDVVWAVIMANANMRDGVALFHGAHGNLSTTAALGTSGKLEAARKAMRIQTENGRNLNIPPRFLLVPPALEDTAEALINSRTLITGENVTKPDYNPNATKGLIVVSDARLENGLVDPTDASGGTVYAGSATTWYLAATAAHHTIERAYLRGTGRVPQVRPFVLTQGRWGIGWDIKHDIGAKALDWRGLHKATA